MKIKIKETYLLLVIVMGLISLSVYTTYALFTANTTINNVVSFNATLNTDNNLIEYDMITLSPGEIKKIEININNTYSTSLYYGTWYQIVSPSDTSNIVVGLPEENTNSSSGVLSKTSSIKLIVGLANNSSKNATINIGTIGSTTSNLNLPTGRNLIPEGFNVSHKLDNSGANYPDLVQGLIPVVYNESTKTWVKADTESSTSTYGWYDYDNKKWANAVLVSETGYIPTDKTVNISNNTTSVPSYTSNNNGVNSSTATSTFTITTGSTAGTLSFDYSVSSESNYDKLTIKVNDTTVVNAISGEQSNTYSISATANTTYTIIATYTKDSSRANGTDTATISNIIMPTGSTISVTNDATYYFAEGTITTNRNKIASSFTYENNKYILQNITNGTEISSSSVGKYICSDITQTECTTMYKITESNTNITKVKEYTDVSIINRSTYQNASPGTEINEQDILAYYVWIPRYKYKVWNKDKVIKTDSYDAYNTGIDIVFENDTESTGTISCVYSFATPSSTAGSPNETCTGTNGDYYTHPAFTFGDTELRGFWIGKFELSSETPTITDGGGTTTTLTPRILPNVISWRNNDISNFSTVIQNMQASNNIYGLSTDKSTTDSHMLTNMEWGAVAYLTNSNYGRCSNGTCTEVTINNCSTRITGIGADTVSAGESSTTCTTDANKYNGEKGVLASTTGNVYGVYDMSGGAYEYVMGNVSSTADAYTFYSYGAGFASNWYNDYSNQKYVNTYARISSYSDRTTQKAYNAGRLGDATGEVVLSDGGSGGWYSDSAAFPSDNVPWFLRGGHYYNVSGAGVFYFNFCSGEGSDSYGSARASLMSLQ